MQNKEANYVKGRRHEEVNKNGRASDLWTHSH